MQNKTYDNEINDRIVYSILKENAINAERSIIDDMLYKYSKEMSEEHELYY